MNLYQLSRAILSLSPQPIVKLRFARIIYFTHKELIRKGFMQIEDIAYIRSPLGPVPESLKKLAVDYRDITLQKTTSDLSYASEEFLINHNSIDQETNFLEQYRDILKVIDQTLQALSLHRTPELIEASHDPSWLANFNGTRYFLTAADLKNTFPFTKIRLRIRIKPTPKNSASANELGRIQANLLRGMLNDIVKESTDLEYPDEACRAGNDDKTPTTLKFSVLPIKTPFNLFKSLSQKKPKPSTPKPPSRHLDNPAEPDDKNKKTTS